MYVVYLLFGQTEPITDTFLNDSSFQKFMERIQDKVSWIKVGTWNKDDWYFNG